MSALAFLAVSVGGALGALCRGLMTRSLKERIKGQFTFPTLIVNLISCFGAGCCAALALDGMAYLLIFVGFLGGLSTLATMNYEAVILFSSKRYRTCAAYLATTYATTLLASAIGFALVSAL